jgi:Tol biopolymer transport system component
LDWPTFSPNGNYIYYSPYEGKKSFEAIYRVPSLGGSPVKVISDAGDFRISPDGLRITFRRTKAKVEPEDLI